MEIKAEVKCRVNYVIYFLLTLATLGQTESNDGHNISNEQYKILLISPVCTRSHKNFYMGTVKALAARNHQVTVLSTFKEATPIPNVKDVTIDGPNMGTILSDPFKKWASTMIYEMLQNPSEYCSKHLAAKEIEELKKETFDLIIIAAWGMNDCFFTLLHHFQVPYVFIFPNKLFGGMHTLAGNIHFESISPNQMIVTANPPTYLDRLKTTSTTFFAHLMFHQYILPRMRYYCEEAGLCSDDIPPFKDFYGNASLVIVNSIKTLEKPAHPWMPHIIHAGGIHCKPANKLPKDLEDWIGFSGEEGFIFFSMGSAVSPSTMPEKYRDIFLKVFGSLKYKVLWKWDQENIDGLPPNVKLSKWLPQQDILGHPKVRLFITHGGLLSTQEATYHSVPVLGIPIFLDQFNNIWQTVRDGWGERIDWHELSEDFLRSKILSVIENPEMKRVVQRRSALMRDRLNQPSDEVAYWIEYTIRHHEGEYTPFSISTFYIWQLYNVDVWALLLLISILIPTTIFLTVRKIFAKIFNSKRKMD